MGCGPGVAGESRSAGVVPASMIISTRTSGSITCESTTPVMKQTMVTPATIQFLRISNLVLTRQAGEATQRQGGVDHRDLRTCIAVLDLRGEVLGAAKGLLEKAEG